MGKNMTIHIYIYMTIYIYLYMTIYIYIYIYIYMTIMNNVAKHMEKKRSTQQACRVRDHERPLGTAKWRVLSSHWADLGAMCRTYEVPEVARPQTKQLGLCFERPPPLIKARDHQALRGP